MMPRRRLLSRMTALAAVGLPAGAARADTVPPRPRRVAYGAHPSQFAELTLPRGQGRVPVVVVVHGGFWRQAYGAELGRPLARDLVAEGRVAALNLEYRRVGGGGGWPATLLDAAAAVDLLAGAAQQEAGGRLDLARVATVGHSAGGHLAVWLAARHRLPTGAPGAAPAVRLAGAVSQAGVLDLVDASEQRLGAGAVDALLGGRPAEVPDRYAAASPAALVPLGVPVVCVHGDADDTVPIRQSERYLAAARAAGDAPRLVALKGAGHFEVIDVGDPAWRACRDAVLGLVGV